MNNQISIEIQDLDQAVGTDLSGEELQAVSGGMRYEYTWVSGPNNKPDEWVIL